MLKVWQRRLFAGGGGMVVLSIVLVALVMVRFRYAPVEGHVLELMMWSFGAGYAFYAGLLRFHFGSLGGLWRESGNRHDCGD